MTRPAEQRLVQQPLTPHPADPSPPPQPVRVLTSVSAGTVPADSDVTTAFRFSVSRNPTDGDLCRGGGVTFQCVAMLSRADDADTVDDNQFGDLSGD